MFMLLLFLGSFLLSKGLLNFVCLNQAWRFLLLITAPIRLLRQDSLSYLVSSSLPGLRREALLLSSAVIVEWGRR